MYSTYNLGQKKKWKLWKPSWWTTFPLFTMKGTCLTHYWYFYNSPKCETILVSNICSRGYPEQLKTTVFPSTAHDTNKQYVCVTLEVNLPPNYPDCEPAVNLRNPRGLDDSTLDHMSKAIREKCAEYLGQPVIFELIEVRLLRSSNMNNRCNFQLIRENLTESNLPTCQCAVCLYGFTAGDSFTKTKCFHYFHSYCLALHVITTERHFKEEQDKLPAWQKQKTAFQVLEI